VKVALKFSNCVAELDSKGGYKQMARKRAEAIPPTPDPLKPSVQLLVKLGSIAVHADEMLSPGGHEYDKIELQTRLADPEVQAWIKEMGAFLPVKR
jgi:hypothetical protein